VDSTAPVHSYLPLSTPPSNLPKGFHIFYPGGKFALGSLPLSGNSKFYLSVKSLPGVSPISPFGLILDSTDHSHRLRSNRPSHPCPCIHSHLIRAEAFHHAPLHYYSALNDTGPTRAGRSCVRLVVRRRLHDTGQAVRVRARTLSAGT